MPTLGSLPTDRPDLELTFIWPENPALHHTATVTSLISLSLTQLLEGQPTHLRNGSLVLIASHIPFRLHPLAEALEKLLRQMASDRCAALVFTGQPSKQLQIPQRLRDLSGELAIPLMTATDAPDRWADLQAEIHGDLLAQAERRAAQLNMLLQQLPAQLADTKPIERITNWLSQTLSAQVIVSNSERVLAASPDTAAERLATAIIRQSMDNTRHDGSSNLHTQIISLGPSSTTATDTVLAVARQTAFDEPERRLLQHGAKILGLIDQAHRASLATEETSDVVHVAVAELLLAGELDKARRVMAPLTPGLLAPNTTRAYVLETTVALRDAVVQRCRAAVTKRALVVADSSAPRRILIINPINPDHMAETSVAGELVRIVASLGPGVSMGGSGIYSLSLVADAINEALTAQRFATHEPDNVALSAQKADLVSLLPEGESRQWAYDLLRPLMHTSEQWPLFRNVLPTALAYQYTVAARRLALHRNTIARHVSRASELLQLNLKRVHHRVTVGLALEIVTQRDAPPCEKSKPHGIPTLPSLLAAPGIATWADTLLHAARDDRRALLATAQSWLLHDTRIEPTARALGLSEVTIRSHLRAIEDYISRDLSSLVGLRDLYFALHIATGLPKLTEQPVGLQAS